MYLFSYMAARFLNKKYRQIVVVVTCLTLVYILIVHLSGLPYRFGSTAIAYSLGMWIALYKESVFELFKGYTKR